MDAATETLETLPENFRRTLEAQRRNPNNKEVGFEWQKEAGGGWVTTISVNFGDAHSMTAWGFDEDGNIVKIDFAKTLTNGPGAGLVSMESLRRDGQGNWVKDQSQSVFGNYAALDRWKREFQNYAEKQKGGKG